MATPPSTPTRKRLTRDQRRDVLLMRRLGYTYQYIASFLHISQRAVQYTCQKQQVTPQHGNAGRPPRLNKEEADKVEQFVLQSRETRQMTYLQVAEALWPEGEVSAESIRYTLHQRGYRRRIALRKPPLSEKNRLDRLEWAKEHVLWTEEQWNRVLWSDETWVTAYKHRRTFVTRKIGEELDTNCVIDRVQRPSGWLFWGCFHASIKGPCLFWEKKWGSISSESYRQRIVPLIEEWMCLHPGLIFMQDNAPAHAHKATIEDFSERDIYPMHWPAFSPDLNPIETLWNEMKDWLARNYPMVTKSQEQLRQRVIEAWEALGQSLLQKLIREMPQRCQDVINADGKHTKW